MDFREQFQTFNRGVVALFAAWLTSLAVGVFLAASAHAAAVTAIVGEALGVALDANNQQTLNGFACVSGAITPLSLELYRGGTIADGGIRIGTTYPANLPNPTGTASACASGSHGFSIPIAESLRQSNAGDRLYVYAVVPGSSTTDALIVDGGAHILAPKVFRPESYGAIPNGSTDSTAGIRAAIKAAMAASPSEVKLSAGTYALKCATPDGVQNACLNLDGAQNVVFGGAGLSTHLNLLTPTQGAISVGTGADGVKLVGFLVDYETPPFTQGKITAVDAKGIYVALDEGMPPLSASNFSLANAPGSFGMIFSSKIARVKANITNNFGTVPNLAASTPASNKWRLDDTSGQVGLNAAVGDRYVQLARGYGYGITFYQAKNISLNGVTMYASPALTTAWVQNSGAIILNDFHVAISPKANSNGIYRLISSNADGAHFQQNRGAPHITNSSFAGMADDAINIYSLGSTIASVTSQTDITLVPNGGPLVAGDTIKIVEPISGLVRGQAVVASVGDTVELKSSTATGIAKGDVIFDTSADGANAIIHDNVFGTFRGTGIKLKAQGSVVSNNQFTDINSSGIDLTDILDPNDLEGPPPYNIQVAGNTFKGGDLGNTSTQILILSPIAAGYGSASVHQSTEDITLTDNVFTPPTNFPAITIGASKYISLNSNLVNGAALALGPYLPLSNVMNVDINGTSVGPGTEPKGLFVVQGTDVYYSNGAGGYCGYASWDQFIACGYSQAAFDAATPAAELPWNMSNGGICDCGGQ